MTEQTPTIGHIVHYRSFGTPGGEYGQECRAAIITAVPAEQKPDGTFVQLCVLNPSGLFFNGAHEDQTGESGGTWHWPERVGADAWSIAPAPAPPVNFTPNTLADDVLGWMRDRDLYSDRATGETLTIEHGHDGTVRIVNPPDEAAIDVALLRHHGLTGVTFDDGVLGIDTETGPVRYEALYAADHGFTAVFRRQA